MLRRDKALRDEVNTMIQPLKCLGTTEVKNIIEVLREYVGIERIARSVAYDLSGLKVVPYYGCVLTRIMKMDAFDDKENPVSMDELLFAAGAEVVSWPFKMECCGASKTLTDKEATLRLSGGSWRWPIRSGPTRWLPLSALPAQSRHPPVPGEGGEEPAGPLSERDIRARSFREALRGRRPHNRCRQRGR